MVEKGGVTKREGRGEGERERRGGVLKRGGWGRGRRG